MGFIGHFKKWMNKTLTVLEWGRTYDAGTGTYGPPAWTPAGTPVTFNCAIWNKSEAEQYVSEQFREEVTDVACSAVISLEENNRLTDGTNTWEIVTRQDIANQGEVLLTGMKRVTQ